MENLNSDLRSAFDDYFNPKPEPTPEEKAERERIEIEQIDNDFWKALDKHSITNDGQDWDVYTEKSVHDDYCLVFKREDSEYYMIFFGNVIKNRENSKAILKELMNMDEGDMQYLLHELVLDEHSPVNAVRKGEHPNKINVSEMGKTLSVHENDIFFDYIPNGIGVGLDTFKEVKKSVGRRNMRVL